MRKPQIRKISIINHLRNIPHIDDQEFVHWLKRLWRISMLNPSIEFPASGIFQCMAGLILKCLKNKSWHLKNQNINIPYYAAHIIGSLTITQEKSAQEAVDAGVIPPLLELLKGNLSWVEQRVSIRALGHLASYEKTFLALTTYEEEIVKLSIHLASTCADVVYKNFVGVKDQKKIMKYHRDLLAKGLGDIDLENQKAEEWAIQLQSWCIYLLNCFAIKKRALNFICKKDFLKELCGMYGGCSTSNRKSPGGIGLIRILCHTRIGRRTISECGCVILSLCNLSRSSDDWQYMGIDCLLLLLKDSCTRYKVVDIAVFCLKDLIELKNIGVRSHVGDMIIKTIFVDLGLRDDPKIKNPKVRRALVEMWDFKVIHYDEKWVSSNKEKFKFILDEIKEKGNINFRLGNIKDAILNFSEGLEKCPFGLKKERMVLYSKRAQCYLLLKDYDAAISDTTRALSISDTPNSHCKSLWRRSVAYDLKGLAKESLIDCIMFITCWFKTKRNICKKIPYYVMKMICKQMEANWFFKNAKLKHLDFYGENKGFVSGLPTILEEPLIGNG